MSWTAPRTWVAGEVVSAALLNTHVRDNLLAITTNGAYTPTWANTGTANALGNGTITGTYISAGKLVIFQIVLTFGSTTAAGSAGWTFTLPVTSNGFGALGAEASFFDSSAGATYRGVAINSSTTVIQVVRQADPVSPMTPSLPFIWTTSDSCSITGTYLAA